MKQLISLNLAIMLCLLISSCNLGSLKGVPIPADKKELIGSWYSASMKLNIEENGHVTYERKKGMSTTSIDGPIQQFNKNTFIVGALGFNTTFVIQVDPHQENGVWKMTVDGEELIRDIEQ